MDVHVSLVSRSAVAEQIQHQLRHAIVRQEISPGQKLPSSRELARQLAVSRTTVTTAYDRLHADGLLESRRGVGVFVASTQRAAVEVPKEDLEFGSRLVPQDVWQTIDEMPDYSAQRPEFDLRAGIPSLADFPFQSWRSRVASYLRASEVGTSAYGDPCGLLALRAALARHIAVSRGVRADPSRIVITSGAQQAFDLIARVLLSPGDLVAVEDPGYSAPKKLFRSLRLRVTPVPVDAEGIVVDAIPAGVRLIYVTPSHQFPLGHVLSHTRRIQLVDWACANDGAIIEDDYDSEFRYGGRPLDALQSIDTSGRVIYVSTFSKVLLPSLRLGFLVAPRSLMVALRKAKSTVDWMSPSAEQAALAAFIKDGHLAQHIRSMRRKYENRHYVLASLLDDEFGPWLQRIPSYAGIHAAALLRPGSPFSDVELVQRAAAVGVGLSEPISYFGLGDVPEGIVLGYGNISAERIRLGMDRLRDVLQGLTDGLTGGAAPEQ